MVIIILLLLFSANIILAEISITQTDMRMTSFSPYFDKFNTKDKSYNLV